MDRTFIAVGAAALALGGGAAVALNSITSESSTSSVTAVAATPTANCEDWNMQLTQGECFAAGIIRNVSLYNLQGAGQFCKWKSANPGEWTRLKGYAISETPPSNIVTWFGAHIKNDLEAYFATGAPTFIIAPNTAPNVCKTPVPPPVVSGVTPGETDATVTIED